MRLIWHDLESVDSTQNFAKKIIKNFVIKEPILVTARRQNGGYGTNGHLWKSPSGNLYATFCISKKTLPKNAEPISIFAAEIMKKAIKNLTKIEIEIKFPNDLMLDKKKCGGILCEIENDQSGAEIMCIGIGINTKKSPKTSQPTTKIDCDPKKLILEWVEIFKNYI